MESGDLSVKVDRHPHASVVGGIGVQVHVAAHGQGLRPNLCLPSTAS